MYASSIDSVSYSLRSIPSSHNIGLHLVLDLISRVARSHTALVDWFCWVGYQHSSKIGNLPNRVLTSALSAVAVIASNSKDNGTLLAHRVVARDAWSRTVVEVTQSACGSITAADSPVVWLAFHDGSNEAVSDCWIVWILIWRGAGEEAVL
jgi:hypothetical protein